MKTARTRPVRVIATLALTVVAFGGCDHEKAAATRAVKQISQGAPTSLPAHVPDELLRVTLGGVEYNLRELLSRPSNSRPSAHIVAAYQTVTTPADPPPFGTSDVAVLPDIGSVEATVANGPDNVPLLRLANVARIDRGLPSEVFSRTTSDGTQTGYVLRLNTAGGIAPTAGCGGTPDVGKRERVPYAADYYFIDVFTTP